MSKRLRTEEEKLKKLKDEDDEVEDKYEIQHKRMRAPLFWKRTASGFRIEDLQEKYFNEALAILKEHYIPHEVLCRNSELIDDEASVADYMQRLLQNLRDMSSVMAVDEKFFVEEEEFDEEGNKKKKKKKKGEEEPIKIAGILVMKVLHKDNFGRVFSRVQLSMGEAFKKCVALTSHLNRKVDIFTIFNCTSFLRYYHLCVLPEYRHKGLGLHMLKSGIAMANAINVPVLMGVFSNYRLQKLAEKIGLKVMLEIDYVAWKDPQGDLIFDDPGAGNYTCALMAGYVPPPPPIILPRAPFLIEKEKTQTKLTRSEKRAAIIKAASK